ncbi:MAG: hypothetical protein AAB225_03770 [Acidobacteriota bacterium]
MRLLLIALSLVLAAAACLLFVIQSEDIRNEPGAAASPAALLRLHEALGRDLGSPDRWCDLAEALAQSQQTAKARYCFRRAVELGPNIPPILMRAANSHFAAGEPLLALPYTARIMELVSEYDAIIFSYYDRLVPNVKDILPHIKANRRALASYFRHLISVGRGEAADIAWTWLAGQSFADDRLAGEYVDFLVRRRQHQRAAQAWAGHLGGRAGGYPKSTLLFNGGFESEPTGAAFDWRVTPLQGVDVERVASAREGRSALRISFAGTANVPYSHVSQSAWIGPGRYRLRGFVRTEDITTDQGILLCLFDAESAARLSVETAQLKGANAWTPLETAFTVPADTSLVIVQVCRRPSRKFDNKIRGTAWIDSVSLEPLQ